MPSIYMPLKPYPMRQQLECGDCVDERDMRRLFVLHGRALKATRILLADGWDVWFTGYGLQAEHPEVPTKEDAITRLAIIGIPLGWVMLSFAQKSLSNDNDG